MNNNEKVADIMDRYGWDHTKLADVMMTTSDTTRAWTCNPESTRYRNVTNQKLKLLQLLITTRKYKPIKE